jgi:hypothetical protein
VIICQSLFVSLLAVRCSSCYRLHTPSRSSLLALGTLLLHTLPRCLHTFLRSSVFPRYSSLLHPPTTTPSFPCMGERRVPRKTTHKTETALALPAAALLLMTGTDHPPSHIFGKHAPHYVILLCTSSLLSFHIQIAQDVTISFPGCRTTYHPHDDLR